MTQDLQTQIKLAARYARAMLEAIQEAGKDGLPSGHLYAAMMPYVGSLDVYNQLLRILEEAGRIRQDNHVLYIVRGLEE